MDASAVEQPRTVPSPRPYRDGSRWAVVAQLSLAVCGLVAVLQFAEGVASMPLVDLVSGAVSADVAESEAALSRHVEWVDALGDWASLGTLVAAVAFIGWLARSVANVPALTGRRTSRGPRGAVGWWFVPIANLWVPYTIVRDVHRRLEERHGPLPLAGALRAWWILWLLPYAVIVAGVVIAQREGVMPFAVVPTSWPQVAIGTIVAAVVTVDAVLAIVIVRRLQAAQQILAATGAPLLTRAPASDDLRSSPWRPVAGVIVLLLAVSAVAWILAPALNESSPTTWRLYRSPDHDFVVDVPGTPLVTTTDLGDGWLATEYALERTNHQLSINVTAVPGSLDASVADLAEWKRILEEDGATLSTWRPTTRGPSLAADMAGTIADVEFQGLVVVTPKLIFTIIDFYPGSTPPLEIGRILESFEVTGPTEAIDMPAPGPSQDRPRT
jgi:hypothetical protein